MASHTPFKLQTLVAQGLQAFVICTTTIKVKSSGQEYPTTVCHQYELNAHGKIIRLVRASGFAKLL